MVGFTCLMMMRKKNLFGKKLTHKNILNLSLAGMNLLMEKTDGAFGFEGCKP